MLELGSKLRSGRDSVRSQLMCALSRQKRRSLSHIIPGAIKVGATELAAVSGNIPDEDTLKLAMVSSKDFPASSTLTGKIKFIIENTGDIEILADYVRGSKTTTITN